MGNTVLLDILFAAIPIVLLIVLMAKPRGVSANVALPLSALVLYGVRLVYFSAEPVHTHAVVLEGLLTALTPILIVWGAIFLFQTMEQSGAMGVVSEWLNRITPNRVGQIMIVAWSFSFLIEGVSGFGTPAALAAPILVGLGFSPVPVATLCLVMNSVPVSFGAVGMPLWFGLGELNLSAAELLEVSFKTALIHSAGALMIPIVALRFVVSTKEILANIRFIALSIGFTMVPFLLLARFNAEFPSILGGFIGFLASLYFAKRGVGLQKSEDRKQIKTASVSVGALVKSLFPLWGTVLVLLITRLPLFGLNAWLMGGQPMVNMSLGGLGEFRMSASLVVELRNIFQAGVNWKHPVLYVPSFLPFVLVSALCIPLFKMRQAAVEEVWKTSYRRIIGPVGAFLGALVFAKLIIAGGDRSSATILGETFANALGSGWQFAAVYLGALGSFFSGSNTVSNLTFGGIQDSIAATLNLNRTTLLSLQAAGGAIGNMVCLHNIVAVCSILGLSRQEGLILKKTVWPMLAYGVLAGLVSLIL